jgi:hypothetical protein
MMQQINERIFRAFKEDELHDILLPPLHSKIGISSAYLLEKITNAKAEELIEKMWITILSERTRQYTSRLLLSALGHRWNILAPLLDNRFADFMLRVPRDLSDLRQELFHNVVDKYFPAAAVIPLDKTGNRMRSTWWSWRWNYAKSMLPSHIRRKYSRLSYKLKETPLVKKTGMGNNRPWIIECDEAIREGSYRYFSDLLSDDQHLADIFNMKAIHRLFRAHSEGRIFQYHKLCAIATIVEWRRQFEL